MFYICKNITDVMLNKYRKQTDMKLILTRKGEVKALALLFGVSRIAINNALRYRFNSPRCQEIRRVAIERGGRETEY